MKYTLLMAVVFAATAHAQTSIKTEVLGSGNQGSFKTELPTLTNAGPESTAPVLSNDIFHTPQYMPNYPTAAPIWPRIIDTDCVDGIPSASTGYHWIPAYGRGEYLFHHPKCTPVPKPKVVEVIVPGPERIILKEVPIKPKRE